MIKYKALRGFDVRVAPGVDEFRRVAEIGDIITVDDVPEWGGKIPSSEIEAGVIEAVSEPAEEPEAADTKPLSPPKDQPDKLK